MAEGVEIGEAYVRIRPKVDGNFDADLKKGVSDPLDNLAGKAKAAFAGIAVAGFLKAGIDELGSAQAAAAQTTAALKSTGGAANVTADDLDTLSESLANLSGADKEAVQAGGNLLLTFRNVRNEVGATNDIYDQALTAAQDLSVAFGQDLQSSVILVGKALDNPVAGLTALQRVGVTLSAQQKQQVKDFVAVGDVMAAQKIILEELNAQVGGSAEAFGETLPGQVQRARNALDDLSAEVVGGAAPALEGLLGIVRPVVDAFSSIPQPVQTGVLALGAVALVAPKVVSALGSIGKITGAASSGMETVALRALYAKDTLAQFAAGAAAAGIVVAGAVAANQIYEQSIRSLDDQVKKITDTQLEAAKSDSFDQLAARIARIRGEVENLDRTRENSKAPWDADARDQMIRGANELDRLREKLEQYRIVAETLAALTGDNRDATLAWLIAQDAAGNSFTDGRVALAAYTGAVDDSSLSTEEAKQATDGWAQSVRDAADAQKAAVDPYFAAVDAQQQLADAQEAAAEAAYLHGASSDEAAAASLDAAQAAANYDNALLQLTAATAGAAGGIDAARAELERMVAQGLITREDADRTIAKFGELGGAAANNIYDRGMTVTANTQPALNAIDELKRTIAEAGLSQTPTGAFDTPEGRAFIDGLLGGPKAAGGRVSAGTTYPVNDGPGGGVEGLRTVDGTTWLTPGQDGTVIPASQMPAGDSGGFHIYGGIHITGTDPQRTSQLVTRRLRELTYLRTR